MTDCASCGATGHAEGARFCQECGARLGELCGTCGASLTASARFCPECGSRRGTEPTEAPERSPGPVASRRVTSVLFGDLVGFTSLSENRDQEDVRELLSSYFEECSRIVGRYGGTVEKFIGDAVMAVWGVPTAHEDDAERAVRAGLELVTAVGAMGADLGVPDLAMRVGIVTGEVAVTVGATQQGMVAGDAVNTAARVQTAATPGQVWVDETTRLLTTSAISYVDVGSHAMKGKADPVPLWAVRAVVANVGGAQRADGLEAPLVGRDRELRLVKELFHAAEETGRPSMLVVAGEAGVGKTRLGWEFEKYTDGVNTSVKWHSGRCLSYGEGVAYYALAEAIRGRLRLLAQPDDPEDDAAEEDDLARLLGLGLDRYVPHPDERAWLGPRVGALLGVGALGGFPREDLYAAWTTFLERVGEGVPVALVVEDAQHADDGLIAFLEHLLSAASFGCFVMLLARPTLLDEHPGLATNRRVTVLHLEALTDQSSGRLLDGLVAGLPDDVRAGLVARAEGIPLYAVETVRSLIDRDLVVPRGGQYVLVDPSLDLDQIGAPPSLQALIAARLDALPPGVRRVLDVGSVLGTSFPREHLALLRDDDVDLDAAVAELTRLQLIGQEANRFSAEHGQLRFVQGAVRQVAYGMLSRRDRRSMHLQVAELLEGDAEQADEVAAVIAQHYLDAADALPDTDDATTWAARAVGHLERAAERATALGSPREAAAHLRTAVARVDDRLVAARLQRSLAEALLRTGDFVGAADTAEASAANYEEMGQPLEAVRSSATRATALADRGVLNRAEEVAAEGLAMLEQLGETDPSLRLLFVRLYLSVALRRGDTDEWGRLTEEEGRLAELTGDPLAILRSLGNRAVYYMTVGQRTLALIIFDAATKIAKEGHFLREQCINLLNAAVAWTAEDLDKATMLAREGADVGRTSGNVPVHANALANLGVALLGRGDWDEALAVLRHDDLVRLIGFGVYPAMIERRIDWARDRSGGDVSPGEWEVEDAVVKAMSDLETAYATWEQDPAEASRLALRGARAAHEALALTDDFLLIWQGATDLVWSLDDLATLDELLLLVESTRTHVRPAGVRAVHGRMRALRDAAAGAADPVVERQLRQAIEAARAWKSPPTVARCQESLGAWLAARGRDDEANPLFAEARTEYQRLGATRWLRDLDAAEASLSQRVRG
ncbi:adenylate/guanylate cyclase domain-containing protein [Nocardioides bigeumensis]|uniref:Adenylate/guanylate cyclase domain-containing protein n=1 Tax=Nocardioides bigeumensis TaxID=433657 RepID=A0ABN2YBC8_9ACTN